MNGTSPGGFVGRAIGGLRPLFDDAATDAAAAEYVPLLVRRLFDEALGYDATAYSQCAGWSEVRFVDETGQPAVVLAASDAGEDIRVARRRAFRAADDAEPVRFLAATNRNRLVCYARCPPGHEEATTRDGVTARPLTEIDLREAVERSRGSSLAAALTPGQQLSVAKLTALRRDALADDPDDPTFGSRTGESRSETTPETLAATLTETFTNVLLPAVEEAFDQLSRRIQAYADREAALETAIEEAKAAGEQAAVTTRRADLFELREQYATARRLEAGFARWRQVTPDPEDTAAFCAESAAVALDTLFLARVAADRGLAGDFEDYRAFWENHAEHAERDAVDLVRAVREELAGVSEDATDDGTFAWVFEAEVADAFDEAVAALSALDVSGLDAAELTAAFDAHLEDDGRPVRGSTRPATAGLLLDRAGYTADAAIDAEAATLLDPACGDGSVLVGAADRLLARLSETDAGAAETLATVRDRLHGIDIHPYAVHLAETRLLLRTVDTYAAAAEEGSFSLGRFELHRTDALHTVAGSHYTGDGRRTQRRHDAEAVAERSGYGYVVGDVPTTARAALSPGSARDAYDEYANATGAYDLSMLFLERAGDWLTSAGRLSMAVDGDLLGAESTASARRQLADGFRLRELVEFDTGSETAPVFVAAECRGTTGEWRATGDSEWRSAEDTASEFTYARVTPTFVDLVREGLVRPDGSGNARPAELVGRCLPAEPGGDPPAMETVLVELDLVCDATVEGAMPVEVETLGSEAVAGKTWAFAAGEDSEPDAGTAGDDGGHAGVQAALDKSWVPNPTEE